MALTLSWILLEILAGFLNSFGSFLAAVLGVSEYDAPLDYAYTGYRPDEYCRYLLWWILVDDDRVKACLVLFVVAVLVLLLAFWAWCRSYRGFREVIKVMEEERGDKKAEVTAPRSRSDAPCEEADSEKAVLEARIGDLETQPKGPDEKVAKAEATHPKTLKGTNTLISDLGSIVGAGERATKHRESQAKPADANLKTATDEVTPLQKRLATRQQPVTKNQEPILEMLKEYNAKLDGNVDALQKKFIAKRETIDAEIERDFLAKMLKHKAEADSLMAAKIELLEKGTEGLKQDLEFSKKQVESTAEAKDTEIEAANSRIADLERDLDLERKAKASETAAKDAETELLAQEVRNLKEKLEGLKTQTKTAITAKNSAIGIANSRISDLKTDLNVAKGSKSELESKVKASESDAEKSQEDVFFLRKKLMDHASERKSLDTTIGGLKKAAADAQNKWKNLDRKLIAAEKNHEKELGKLKADHQLEYDNNLQAAVSQIQQDHVSKRETLQSALKCAQESFRVQAQIGQEELNRANTEVAEHQKHAAEQAEELQHLKTEHKVLQNNTHRTESEKKILQTRIDLVKTAVGRKGKLQ